MNPRMRRLSVDAEVMRTEFAGHPHITVVPEGWEPYERYTVHYGLRGVVLSPPGQPSWSEAHTASIVLPAAYPRQKPFCTMQTPIFHPNFGAIQGEEICLGDYWTPAQTLPDIVVKIGQMIQYQVYNVRSPLNAVAARWTAGNEALFPVGEIQLFQAEPEVTLQALAPSPEPGPTTHQAASAADAGPGDRT